MKNVKEVKSSSLKQNLITVLCIGLVLILLLVLINLNKSKEKTISVVRAKQDIYTNKAIEKTLVEKYDMPYNEYSNSGNNYLLWEDVEECYDQYASVFTKAGLYIIKDDYNPTRPVKNEWLTKAEDGSIYVSIPYDKNDAFGNILTPGDYIRVNISYQKDSNKVDSLGYSVSGQTQVNEDLFNKIQVVDMLNAKGNSIYDYYMDLLSMSVAERSAYLRDDSFLNDVSPTDILLKISNDTDFKKFSEVRGYSSLKYTYGLYPRIEEDTVLEQFRDLTRQITAAQTSNVDNDSSK